jgi:hypothetical protein
MAGQQQDAWVVPPGFFLRMVQLPAASTGESDYVNISIAAESKNIAIEQFDAGPRDRVMFGFGEGWLEQDYDRTTGLRGRWLSERGQLQVRGIGRPLTLRIDGESPRKYYARSSRLLVRVGDRVVLDERLSADFSLTATIPAEAGNRQQVITFETDQVFVPAERTRRSADRRRLGLRIFKCQLRPAA